MGDGSLIPSNRDVMEHIQARVGELKALGRSADEATAIVETELRERHPDWPRSNGIARRRARPTRKGHRRHAA